MAKLKISYPVFRHAPAVTMGRGSLRSLQDLDLASTVFMISSDESVGRYLSKSLERIECVLSQENCLRKPEGEPTTSTVRMAASFLSNRTVERLIAVGGGSVMDWARLAWAECHGVIDLSTGTLDQAAAISLRPEFWLVPTTCGTGAEAADVVVFSRDSGEKISVTSPAFSAAQVVLDSRFLDPISAPLRATFVCDAVSHAVESYVSVVPNSLAKESAISALRLIMEHYSSAAELAENDRLLEASFMAGGAASNCSVGIVHAFAHSIGADGMAHGLANACALEVGIRFNAQAPQIMSLLQRLGFDDVDDLIKKLQLVINCALKGIHQHPLAKKLVNPEYQSEIAQRMFQDITIRSNPRRPELEDLQRFVAEVVTRITRK